MAHLHPTDRDYAIDNAMALRLKTFPYVPSNNGMGINLAPVTTNHRVFVTPHNDCARFNGADNLYAKKILALTMDDMRQRKNNSPPNARTGEKDSFYNVMLEEAEKLGEAGGFIKESVGKRRLKVMWRVMCAFNSDQPHNAELNEIALDYVKIRLGEIQHVGNEFAAATYACQRYYLRHTPDNGSIGEGTWALPLVHLLNGHLKARGIEQITFKINEADDDGLRQARAANTKNIWTEIPQSYPAGANVPDPIPLVKVRASIETRADIVRELIAFGNNLDGGNHAIAVEAEPPAAAAVAPVDANARKRVVS